MPCNNAIHPTTYRSGGFLAKNWLKEKYGFFIDTKLVNLLHREIKNGLIKAKGPAIHYPFLKGLVFLTKEQIYDLDEFVNQMRNLTALNQSLANRKLNDTLKETAEYENIEYIIFILGTSRKESRNGIKYQNLLYAGKIY